MNNFNPYDCGQLGMGANQPCPKCGKIIDKRVSNYEPSGFVKYCKCNKMLILGIKSRRGLIEKSNCFTFNELVK